MSSAIAPKATLSLNLSDFSREFLVLSRVVGSFQGVADHEIRKFVNRLREISSQRRRSEHVFAYDTSHSRCGTRSGRYISCRSHLRQKDVESVGSTSSNPSYFGPQAHSCTLLGLGIDGEPSGAILFGSHVGSRRSRYEHFSKFDRRRKRLDGDTPEVDLDS
jgi:hypothetical protein